MGVAQAEAEPQRTPGSGGAGRLQTVLRAQLLEQVGAVALVPGQHT
jgi:hypothetical protein